MTTNESSKKNVKSVTDNQKGQKVKLIENEKSDPQKVKINENGKSDPQKVKLIENEKSDPQKKNFDQTVDFQMSIFLKGAMEIVGEDELRTKIERSLKEQRPLHIKLGLDPSAPDIHLGHAVVLRKLKQLQDLGHAVKIIIGDFTGRIGDPTGKSKGRKAMSDKQVMENAMTYKEQIFKILDPEKTEVFFNGEWLELLNLEDVLKMASTMTVARMLERDDFKKRFTDNIPIGLHEFFYPLMQAYDSIAIDADVELGGTDQTFNILMGRNLQRVMGKEPQVAIFMPILEGLDGVEKMSKSLANYIGVNEEANVMFKKVMEVPDSLIIRYFELTTDEMPQKIHEIKEELARGKNPRDVKLELAKIITSLYHGEAEMRKAEQFYVEALSKKAIPTDIPVLELPGKSQTLFDILPSIISAGYISSSSECRRLLTQGGVRLNGEQISSIDTPVSDGDVIQFGKKKFLKLHIIA